MRSARIQVRQITAAEALPLRLQVLRPGRPPETAVFAGDELPTTTHWGAFEPDGTAPLAIATLMQTPLPNSAQPGWQIRGMASSPRVRGQGYGAAVLRGAIDFANQQDPTAPIWCNARMSALAFYHTQGFETVGAEFEIAGVGPHYVMRFKK